MFINLEEILITILDDWTEEKYCVGTFARDSSSNPVHYNCTTAVRWCIMGYISKISHVAAVPKIGDIIAYIAKENGLSYTLLAGINDKLGYDIVQGLVLAALKMLQEVPQEHLWNKK